MWEDSFVIYSSFYKPISKLSDKQLGRLFRAIFKYNLGEVVDVEEDIEMAFGFFVNQFEIDEAKYQSKIMRDVENGRKGGNPNFKRGQRNPYYDGKDKGGLCKITQDNPGLSEITQDNPGLSEITQDKAINDNVNDNDNGLSATPFIPRGGNVAEARGRVLDEFFSKRAVLESFCMNNCTSVEELRGLANQIFDEWELVNERDCSEKHLLSTLRIKLNARNENNTGGGRRYQGRRSAKLPPEPGCGLIEA